MSAHPARSGIGMPLVASVLLHVAVAASFLVVRPAPRPPAPPPSYKVNLVAAPPGPRAVGVVQPPAATPAPPTPPKPPPPRPVTERAPTPAVPTAPARKAAPAATPRRSTPTVAAPDAKRPTSTADAPRAGGGPEGGRGTDVATVRTQGIEFPYPGYLENVVRQIALRFHPPRNSALRAEVSFLIRRDGSVSDLRVVSPSGAFAFDLEARGAVEAAAQARAFGPLPAGFRDDVLPVVFSFDPRLIR